jgi:hypothetical protein
MGIELENIINLLEEAIVEEDWTAIEQVLEILKSKVDNPFDGYDGDVDIEEY